MTNLVIASTIVTPTGTGITLEPWNLQGPKAEYVDVAPAGGVNPLKLSLTRTSAVATRAYEGAHRAVTRAELPVVHGTTGVVWPEVGTLSFSHPAFLTAAQKTAFETQFLLIALHATIRAFHQVGTVPQS